MPPTLEELRERARPWAEPVPGATPAGVQAKHEPAYEAITVEVARLESPASAGVRWDEVVRGAGELLRSTTKDLWLAAYLAYGLYATRGLDGAATGAALIVEVTERYWPDLYPEVKRLRGRANAVGWFVERMGRILPSVDQSSVSAESLEALAVAMKWLAQVSRERFADSAPAFGPLQDAIARLRAGLPPPTEPAPADAQDSTQADATTGEATASVHANEASAHGASGEGASANGAAGGRASAHGATGSGASAPAAAGSGASAHGATGSGASSHGAASPAASPDAAAGSGASPNAAAGNGASGNASAGNEVSLKAASGNGASAKGASARGASANGASGNAASGNTAGANATAASLSTAAANAVKAATSTRATQAAPAAPVVVPALPTLPASPDLSSAEAVTDFLRTVGTALLGAAGALRRASVEDPLPYRLMRTGLWLHLSRPPAAGANGRTPLQPMPAALRTKLETLESNQRWADLLDESESALGQHRFALGLHRFSATALTGLGESHTTARAALVQELGTQLRRMPGVEELLAADGTPLTDEATRAWLRTEVLPASTPTPSPVAASVGVAPLSLPPLSFPTEASSTGSGPALEDEARALLDAGRVHEAVTLLQGAVASATTGRARFLSRLALARLCANAGQLPLARAVYDVLDEEVSAHVLDTWEPALAAACLEGWLSTRTPGEKEGGRVAPKIRNRYRRLARLDSSAALRVGA